MTCFNFYVGTFSSYVVIPSLFWASYIPHDATKSLMNYVNIQQNLKQVKGVAIHYIKYLVRSMPGFLFYVKFKESNKAANYLLPMFRQTSKVPLGYSVISQTYFSMVYTWTLPL
jgi:hypothetical protein